MGGGGVEGLRKGQEGRGNHVGGGGHHPLAVSNVGCTGEGGMYYITRGVAGGGFMVR